MKNKEIKNIFNNFLKQNNLRTTKQRDLILNIFLQKKHITIEQLYESVKKKDNTIGIATVYRTLKLFCEANICNEIKLRDGTSRYEPVIFSEHHDHLICINCGKVIEVFDKEIENIQMKICKEYDFELIDHKLTLYGLCKECREKLKKERNHD